MKTLSDYCNAPQSACFDKHGVIFAFSKDQFDRAKTEGVRYAIVAPGCLCPTTNVDAFLSDHETIMTTAIAQDIEENGLDQIIFRELRNHEAFYTGSVDDTVEALANYPGVSRDKVLEIYMQGVQ